MRFIVSRTNPRSAPTQVSPLQNSRCTQHLKWYFVRLQSCTSLGLKTGSCRGRILWTAIRNAGHCCMFCDWKVLASDKHHSCRCSVATTEDEVHRNQRALYARGAPLRVHIAGSSGCTVIACWSCVYSGCATWAGAARQRFRLLRWRTKACWCSQGGRRDVGGVPAVWVGAVPGGGGSCAGRGRLHCCLRRGRPGADAVLCVRRPGSPLLQRCAHHLVEVPRLRSRASPRTARRLHAQWQWVLYSGLIPTACGSCGCNTRPSFLCRVSYTLGIEPAC